jgi:hypothetical protein
MFFKRLLAYPENLLRRIKGHFAAQGKTAIAQIFDGEFTH